MPRREIEPGSVVMLASGSPRMTVLSVDESGEAKLGFFPYIKDETAAYQLLTIPLIALIEAPPK